MKKDARYSVNKPIVFGQNQIDTGRIVYRTHGCYYLDGGLLPEAYQKFFSNLVDSEEKSGWNYLTPLKTIDYRIN